MPRSFLSPRVSPELRAAIELQNQANRIAKVESRKPRRVQRMEANAVKAEMQHDAGLTKKQRRVAERVKQARLTADRARAALQKRVGEMLKGLPENERLTETGIVLPKGEDIGRILSRVRE